MKWRRLSARTFRFLELLIASYYAVVFNEAYLVRCENGSKFVARLSAIRARGPANIDYEVSLLNHLAGNGAAVADAIRSDTGASCAVLPMPEGNRPLALFRFVNGTKPETLEDYEVTGSALAEMHIAAREYSGPESRFNIDAEHLLHKPLQWLLSAPTMDDDLRQLFSQLAVTLNCELAEKSGLSIVACHGDCHGGNNFVRIRDNGDRSAVFFDFDDSAPGFLSYDLAVILWTKLFDNSLAKPDQQVTQPWRSFINGYEQRRSIKSVDIEAIPLFVRLRHFWFLGEYATRLPEWGSQRVPAVWLRKQADLLHSWQELESPGW